MNTGILMAKISVMIPEVSTVLPSVVHFVSSAAETEWNLIILSFLVKYIIQDTHTGI